MSFKTIDKQKLIHFGIHQYKSYQEILEEVDCSLIEIIRRCYYEINLKTSINKQVIKNSKVMLYMIYTDYPKEDYPELCI